MELDPQEGLLALAVAIVVEAAAAQKLFGADSTAHLEASRMKAAGPRSCSKVSVDLLTNPHRLQTEDFRIKTLDAQVWVCLANL